LEEHRRVADALLGEMIPSIEKAAAVIVDRVAAGGRVLAFGNGGSAADAQHFVAELVGRYRRERRALAAIALTTDTSILTAVANDYGYDRVFERQIEAHAGAGDVAFGISTSGNSESVLKGLAAARSRGAATVALGGGTGGRLAAASDVALIVPSAVTARIQEAHITIIHVLCELIDEAVAPR
jgi:D-sedoheptulose 7-phosphate isomerase